MWIWITLERNKTKKFTGVSALPVKYFQYENKPPSPWPPPQHFIRICHFSCLMVIVYGADSVVCRLYYIIFFTRRSDSLSEYSQRNLSRSDFSNHFLDVISRRRDNWILDVYSFLRAYLGNTEMIPSLRKKIIYIPNTTTVFLS